MAAVVGGGGEGGRWVGRYLTQVLVLANNGDGTNGWP